jgi:plastocyanin
MAVAAAAGFVAFSLVVVASSYDGATAVGQPPPEWDESAGSWPSHEHDLASTRATHMRLLGAAAPGFHESPRFQLIASSLPQANPMPATRQTAAAGGLQAAATTIRVRGGEFFFRLSAKSIPRPGRVTFVFRNVGQGLHDLEINGKRTPLIQRGKTARLVVTFKKRGRYPYICTVPGHAAAGMRGVFTVR